MRPLILHPDRLFPTDPSVRSIARRLYEAVAGLMRGKINRPVILRKRAILGGIGGQLVQRHGKGLRLFGGDADMRSVQRDAGGPFWFIAKRYQGI